MVVHVSGPNESSVASDGLGFFRLEGIGATCAAGGEGRGLCCPPLGVWVLHPDGCSRRQRREGPEPDRVLRGSTLRCGSLTKSGAHERQLKSQLTSEKQLIWTGLVYPSRVLPGGKGCWEFRWFDFLHKMLDILNSTLCMSV